MTRIEHIESADSTSGNRAIIIGAGLGGGSADAAFFLKLLNVVKTEFAALPNILLEKGINAYYSSCITTSLERKNYLKKNIQPEGIMVIGAFDRLKPTLDKKSIVKLFMSILKYPIKKTVYALKVSQFNRYLNNKKIKIYRHSKHVKEPIKSHTEGL